MNRIEDIKIENAKIRMRNFAGKKKVSQKTGAIVNAEGDRNFTVFLDEELADQLRAEGWNIKRLEEKDDMPAQDILKVSVRFDKFPPKIYKYTSTRRVLLNEETVDGLDEDIILNVDLVISPHPWEVNGKSGIKAYAKLMHITIADDVFADKYASYED